jgi:hypothetical protein
MWEQAGKPQVRTGRYERLVTQGGMCVRLVAGDVGAGRQAAGEHLLGCWLYAKVVLGHTI